MQQSNFAFIRLGDAKRLTRGGGDHGLEMITLEKDAG